MNTTERNDQIAASLRGLASAYSKAMAQLEETLAVLCRELELGEMATFLEPLAETQGPAEAAFDEGRPVADNTLLSIRWRGKSCFLGNTIPFWFFERLARRPNQYFSYQQLLDDVWEGPRTSSAIHSVAKVLRRKLGEAGMADLARAIDGSVYGHYGLRLDRGI